jgi:hypothetical protein
MTALAIAGIAFFAVAVVAVAIRLARDVVRQYRSLRGLVRAGVALKRAERADSDRG